MEELKTLFENRLFLVVFSVIFGAIIAHVFSKIRNKTGVFGYYVSSIRIGLSTDDLDLGSVRVTWQEKQVRNLYLYNIEVENLTSKDYEHIDFTVCSGPETLILNENTAVIGAPYIIPWSEHYQQKVAIPQGERPTALQSEEYYHSREYFLRVFNRGQKLRFSYLCTKPNDDSDPTILLSTPSKGVRLKKLRSPYVIVNPIWGVPVPIAIVRAVFISALVVLVCGLFIQNVWLASAISMFVGLSAQLFGAAAYKIEKLLKKLIAG